MEARFIPIIDSGTYPEKIFGPPWGEFSRVFFTTDDGEEWVGVFNAGLSGFDAVVPFGDDDGRTVLVIARGRGYVLEPDTRELIRETPWDYATAAIAVPGRDFVIVAEGHIRASAVGRH